MSSSPSSGDSVVSDDIGCNAAFSSAIVICLPLDVATIDPVPKPKATVDCDAFDPELDPNTDPEVDPPVPAASPPEDDAEGDVAGTFALPLAEEEGFVDFTGFSHGMITV